ncbi:MAG TPA: DUF6805 domain-containing protein, partial [Gemmatimonadaceae bacterium]|nr:DUF6805 domain-containing protein [Gemmatimonadaceae bacterium]
HEYQRMFESFTCCVGTGMENHALHGDGVYFEDGHTLWWNQFVPSTAAWEQAGAHLTQDTQFPEGESARLTLRLGAPREFTLAVRRPYWVGDGFAVTVNGQPVAPAAAGAEAARHDPYAWPAPLGSYVNVKRTWRSGDVVEVTLPKTLRLEPTPDNPRRAAIMWGPLVLSGDIGPEPAPGPGADQRPAPPVVPVLVAVDQPLDTWIETVSTAPVRFRTKGVGRDPNAAGAAHDVDLVPFYRLQERTYATYWDLFTPEDWKAKQGEYARDEARQRALEAATVAFVEPGNRSEEPKFNYQGGDDVAMAFMRHRTGRAGRSWFSYDLAVDPTHRMAVVVTYYSADRRTLPADFQILVDGRPVGHQKIERSDPGRFFDISYPVSPELLTGKTKVTVRFQATEGGQIAAVFGVRVLRADALEH